MIRGIYIGQCKTVEATWHVWHKFRKLHFTVDTTMFWLCQQLIVNMFAQLPVKI